MGSSDSSAKYEGCVFAGKHNSYKLLRKIGSGGNGEIYDAEIVGDLPNIPASQDGYVVKVLTQDKDRSKRIERFTLEVDTVLKYKNQVSGMMPIYDYSLDKTNDLYWLLMPKARKYLYYKNRAYDSLKQMLELGQIILSLHSLQCAHRDIKPDNILFYDNHIHLSDYGLVWDADIPLAITDAWEHLGPFIIRPPEFEKDAYRVEDIKMFRASDVYLFAKTLWIVISKIDHGFFGEYSRTDTSKCLNRDELKLGITIEPLHRLMEGATKDNYIERISIEECLEHIRIQLQIKEGILPQKELDKLAFSERINAAKNAVRPNELIYTETVSALTVIAEFSNVADVVVNNSIHPIHLGRLQSAKLFNESVIKLDVRDVTGKKEYYISVEHVKINSEGLCNCLLKKKVAVTDLSIKRIAEINEFELLTVKKAILDTAITLSFECPNP